MKFTLSWLKDYLDTTATLDEILVGLIGVGLEVEEISDSAKLRHCAFKSMQIPTLTGGVS